MGTMKRIKAPIEKKHARKVAAYARISMETERSPKSLSLQISYYSELIQSTPGWEYAGVFYDSGISGTTTSRAGFQEMLEKARGGHIDLILTKSISRFARNTVDLLETCRELKIIGVEVFFEKENITTFSDDGELMLTLIASFAQAESEQLSANTKWRIQKKFEQGRANGFHLYGYTTSSDATDVQIIPEEANVIRWVYKHYMDPMSCEAMARELTKRGVRFPQQPTEKIDPESVRRILKNPAYTGELLLGQWFVPEGKIGRAIKNTGQKPQYLVQDAIPQIISHEQFEAVQAELARRRNQGAKANWSIPTTCFTSLITCGQCSKSFSRSGKRNTQGKLNYVWVCRTKRDGVKRSHGRTCTNKMIPEIILQETTARILGIDEFDAEVVEQRITHIDAPEPHKLIYTLIDGQVIETQWHSDLKKRCWDDAARAKKSTDSRRFWASLTPDQRRKQLQGMRDAQTPEIIAARVKAARQAWTPEMRAKQAERNRQRWAKLAKEEKQHCYQVMRSGMTEEAKQRQRESISRTWTPERRQAASQRMKELRANGTIMPKAEAVKRGEA